MPLIMRSSAAFSWLTGSFGFISFFSEGTWSARGWRCPTGASGKHLLVRVHRRRCGWISRASRLRNRRRTVDKGQQGYRRDQLLLIMGLRVGIPYRNHGEGKLDRQAAASLTLCSDAPARGVQGGCLARRCRAYGRPDRTKGLPTAHAKWIGRYDRRGVILQHGSVRSIRAMRALRWLDGASGAG